jgi:hypothetical protein
MSKILLLILGLLVIPLHHLIAQAPKIIAYQYWFDDNDAGMISQSVSPASTLDLTTSVNVPAFPVGFHNFHIRFKDDSLRFSPVTSSLFFFPVSTLINGYEYWFNNDYAGKTAVGVNNTSFLDLSSAISVSSLNSGLNILNIRFRDLTGSYSSTSSAYFEVLPEIHLSGYEYWFDNDYGDKTTVNISNTQILDLSEVITATSLQLGFHTFHIRFKNSTGTWCSTQSDLFYKHGTGNQNNLISYEYWFDDNPGGKVSVPLVNQPTANVVATINAAALPAGLHKAHVRFQSGDLTSVVSSSYLYKSGTANIPSNAVCGYRYWFDNDPATLRSVTISPSASGVTLLDSVELPYLPLGKHQASFEFRDTLGAYSSVIGDSIDIFTCQPYGAGTISGNPQVCKGSSGVTYSIAPISNATGYSWSIPAGATLVSGANTRTIVVNYIQNAVSGFISVSGTNPCGTGVARFLAITVNAPPVPVITGDTVVCAGALGIHYTTEAGKTGYTWSVTSGGTLVSGNGTNHIIVNWTSTGGSQAVTCGYNGNGGCFGSKTITVTVKPLPPTNRTIFNTVVPTGQTFCSDATDTLFLPGKHSMFQVQSGGSAILIAGKDIRITFGTIVSSGGYFHGYISNNCLFCNALPHTLPQVLKQEELTEGLNEQLGETAGNSYFRVYPNPTTGHFTLESTNGENLSGLVEIYGMRGEKLFSGKLKPGRKHELSLQDSPNGIYVIRLFNGGVSATSRIIKY